MSVSSNNLMPKTVTTYTWRECVYYLKKCPPPIVKSLLIPKQISCKQFFFSGPGSKTAAGGSGPSSRPPWVTDPNFADRYRPDKTSTVVTQHQQPVQPTPMQNRSSILQAAQQAPEDGGRTPLCGACNKIIRWDRTATSMGRVEFISPE